MFYLLGPTSGTGGRQGAVPRRGQVHRQRHQEPAGGRLPARHPAGGALCGQDLSSSQGGAGSGNIYVTMCLSCYYYRVTHNSLPP